ncbi:MAG: tetratricopeptide repeat protein [Phocaeicola sp.]
MKTLSIILSIWFSCAVVAAQPNDSKIQADSIESHTRIQNNTSLTLTKEAGDNAFVQNDFKGAIAIYEQILETQGVSAEIYYNLGNSYYKDNEIAKAVLNYERAHLLDPSDKDILFNLELARAKTVDKVTPQPELFLVTWYNAITNSLSEKSWSILGITLFLSFIASLSIYLFGRSRTIRKIAFIGASLSLPICLLANLFAYHQKGELLNQKSAIIMEPSVTVRSTPNGSGTELFILHEGRKVTIKDNSMKAWKEIELEDGNAGWIATETLEII